LRDSRSKPQGWGHAGSHPKAQPAHVDRARLVPAIAEAICRVIADPALGKEIGARGRARVKDHFSVEQTARNVEKLYLTMIPQRA